jgi:hypothetical protein
MNSPAIIRQRRDSASAWTSANPILHSGQLGFELDTRKLKIGNGTDTWNNLPYVGTPLDATYLVKDANGDLTAERVVGNSTSVTANWDTAGAVSFERAAFTGDVTAAANSNTLTIANSAVTFSKLQKSVAAGLSVIGRNTNSIGDFGEIAAANDGEVLRLSGTTLGFGTIATAGIANSAVTLAKIENLAATTVIGNATGAAAVPTAIAAGADHQVLRRSGTTLGFGTIATAGIANSAVTLAKIENLAANTIIGNATGAAAAPTAIAAGTDHQVLRRSGTTLGFGTIATEGITNSAVTYAKIQNVSATSRLLGRTSAGAGVVEEISLGNGLTFSSGNLVFSAGTANQVLFNNSSTVPSGDAKLTFNPAADTLTLGTAIGGIPKLASSNTTFNILPTTVTALTVGDLASIEFGKSITTARNYDFGNSGATHATVRVYGGATITGAIRVGASNSGNIQDSAGTNKISFTSTDTTISGTGGITLTGNTIKSSTNTAITLSGTNVTVGGNLTVTGNNINSNTATAVTLLENDATISGHITSNEGYRLGASAVNAQTGTTYTLALADNGRIVTCNNAAAITVTVPTGLPANFTCTVVALGTGKVTLSQNSTTLNWYGGTGNVTIAGQYGAATLLKYTGEVFHVSGTLQ